MFNNQKNIEDDQESIKFVDRLEDAIDITDGHIKINRSLIIEPDSLTQWTEGFTLCLRNRYRHRDNSFRISKDSTWTFMNDSVINLEDIP